METNTARILYLESGLWTNQGALKRGSFHSKFDQGSAAKILLGGNKSLLRSSEISNSWILDDRSRLLLPSTRIFAAEPWSDWQPQQIQLLQRTELDNQVQIYVEKQWWSNFKMPQSFIGKQSIRQHTNLLPLPREYSWPGFWTILLARYPRTALVMPPLEVRMEGKHARRWGRSWSRIFRSWAMTVVSPRRLSPFFSACIRGVHQWKCMAKILTSAFKRNNTLLWPPSHEDQEL